MQKTRTAAPAKFAMSAISALKQEASLSAAAREQHQKKPCKTDGDWLEEYREKNRLIFEQKPLKKSKYTSIARLEGLLKAPSKAEVLPKITGGSAMVMRFSEAAEKMPGVLAGILAKEEKAKDQFEAFINANFANGFVAIIGKECDGKTLTVELSLGEASCGKGIIVVEKGVKAGIIEKITGNGNLLYSESLYVMEGGSACYSRIHEARGSVIDYQQCIIEKDSSIVSNNSWFEGGLVRANTCNMLEGKGSRAEDYSLLLASGNSHYDINYSSVHRAPDSSSHSIFNSVLRGESKAVYDGMIRIELGGARANALLETHSMILGDKASSNQIPQLEIKTDDVKATHSATVAHIEEDELFYLQAKGIPGEDARKMVVKSFLESIVFKLPQETGNMIADEIESRL